MLRVAQPIDKMPSAVNRAAEGIALVLFYSVIDSCAGTLPVSATLRASGWLVPA